MEDKIETKFVEWDETDYNFYSFKIADLNNDAFIDSLEILKVF